MGKLITAPSGVLVEIKEVKGFFTIVYQLDKYKKRKKERKANGNMGFLKGIITTSKIKEQL